MSGTPGDGIAGKVVAITGASACCGAAMPGCWPNGARGWCLAPAVDVSHRADLQRMVDAPRERFGRLSGWQGSAFPLPKQQQAVCTTPT